MVIYPFPNVQDSLKLLKDQTFVQTNSKLYVYNGNETSTNKYVGQQLTFDIDNTPGLQAISGRLNTTTSLKVEKPAILETENYFFAVGGKNKNSLSSNFNLKNIISFAPKNKKMGQKQLREPSQLRLECLLKLQLQKMPTIYKQKI